MATAARPVMTEAPSPDKGASLQTSLPLKQQSRMSNHHTVDTEDTASMADESWALSVSVGSYASRSQSGGPPLANVNVDTRGVRQRLRDQEAKINALLHAKPPSGGGSAAAADPANEADPASPAQDVLLKLIDTLESDLKTTQAEKVKLQQDLEELSRLKGVDRSVISTRAGEDQEEDESIFSLATFPSQRTSGARTTGGVAVAPGTSGNSDRVAQLEEMVRLKTEHVALLHDRWESTLRRMVTYQCELETHDLHLTQFAAEQDTTGQEALAELHDLTRKGQPKQVRHIGKKAKKMMSSLLDDLEALSARYQEARVSHERKLAAVRQSAGQWQRRAERAEIKLQQAGIALNEEKEDDGDATTLRDFHEKLSLQESATKQAQEELGAKLKASQWEVEQSQVEKDMLRKEIQRLQRTVSQLQRVTQQQQDALQEAGTAATNAAAAVRVPKKKKWFAFRKKKPTLSRPVLVPIPPPPVDVAAALVPMQHESQRFDQLHERMQNQRQALLRMQADLHQEMRQKKQLARTVADLRLEQEQTTANVTASDSAAVVWELQDQLKKLEARRVREEEDALETIQELQSRVGDSVEC